MGGKTATSTQQVSVPPQVLAQYQAVNNLANSVATQPTTSYQTEPTYTMGPNGVPIQTGTQQVPVQGTELKPFQTYGGEFVAPVNAEQQSGIAGTNAAAGQAQPYFDAATGTLGQAQAGANTVNRAAESGTATNAAPLSGEDINRYLSPYLGDVLGSTSALINQNNQQQQAGQLGNAIRSGAFGGDRTGIAAANLEQQQNLANANIYSGIANQGYQSALGTAQGQQQIGLAGAKQLADIGQTAYGEGANTSTTLAGLGAGAQSAGLQGAQAKIAAGTVQQQTQQAQDTAQYQQFLQQQSYPFQVAQFLANIAEGTGALSGSTTTTQQPGGFFSDERLKEDMEPIGKTFDGQPIYRYRMKGDDREQIGLSAQQVEKKHPHAVGLAGGYRFVDYGKATDVAANRGHFYSGGVTRASLHERRAYAYGGGPDDSNGGLGAVLAAQQGMYSNREQPAQRNIPTGGASHQLAVAQGTPAPPPSGSNKVSQTVGLGKNAYQGYKWLNKPSPTAPASHGVAGPGSQTTTYTPGLNSMPDAAVPQQPGVTTNFEAGPGTTTTFDAAPVSNSAGLGAADTSAATSAAAPAATDAAASGATEVAAGTAAESAATGAAAEGAAGAAAGTAAGAATGAVAAGAADAAATEAAALAAEYAATYAAMAAVAAKRGGRIRGKYASGGTPYETTYELSIPDEEQSGEHLQSPGPLVKQPTGLQTAMKMGDPNQWEGLASSMSSNTALASGGVAGRRGYDDGGAPEQDSDPGDVAPAADSTPQIASDSERGAGIVGRKGKSWRDYATAENVVPLLTGLAAMGTAPTRSAGVALAAGLGAGAQSYLGTRRSLAETAQEQAKTRGIDIANQLAAMKVKAAQDYLSSPGTDASSAPVNPYGTAPAPEEKGQTAAEKMDAYYRNKYFVQPWTPAEQEAQRKARGAAIAGIDQPLQQVEAARNQRILNQSAQNQSAAQHEANALYAKATDPNATEQEKQAALIAYNAIHQWTGDTYTDMGGVKTNSRTGAPAIGVAAQQLSPQSWVSMMNEANRLVDVPQSDGSSVQVPNWKAHGAAAPEDYARQLASAAPPPPSSTAPNAAQPAAAAPRKVVAPRPAAPPVFPVAPATAAQSDDPYLAKALNDSRYKLKTPPVVSGVTATPAALDQQHATVTARNQLQKDSEDAVNAGSASLQYLEAAKAIMDSKGKPVVGLYGPVAKDISRVFGGVSAANYQEVAKYLGNAAVQAGRANFPNATQSEVGLQLNELSPSVHMEDAAVNDLLAANIRSSHYTVDSANRVKSYLDRGGDPQTFQKWNQAWYPREKIINTPTEGAVKVNSRAEAMRLAPGTVFITPDGRRLVR